MEEQDSNPVDSEALAWRELVQSDGWRLVKALAEELHGPAANVRAIDAALASVGRGDREAAEDTVIQIRARALAVEKFLAAAEERAKAAQPKSERLRPFAALRRIGR